MRSVSFGCDNNFQVNDPPNFSKFVIFPSDLPSRKLSFFTMIVKIIFLDINRYPTPPLIIDN